MLFYFEMIMCDISLEKRYRATYARVECDFIVIYERCVCSVSIDCDWDLSPAPVYSVCWSLL